MDAEARRPHDATLQEAIHEIHRQNASHLSFEELYRNAYNMVLHKFGDKLYTGLVDTVTTHLKAAAEQVEEANEQLVLEALKDKWEKHKLSAIMIRDILMYMDRTYVQAQKKTPVYDRALPSSATPSSARRGSRSDCSGCSST